MSNSLQVNGELRTFDGDTAMHRDPRDSLLDLLGPDRLVDLSKGGLAGDPWNYGASLPRRLIDIAATGQRIRTLPVGDQPKPGAATA